MAYIKFTNNPYGRSVGDCVIRALSVATDDTWDDVFWGLAHKAFSMGDMMSSNSVWGEYLRERGFRRYTISNNCPDCYTIAEFARDNPIGTFVVGTGTHAVAVIDGNVIDAWDSSMEIPVYFYRKEK